MRRNLRSILETPVHLPDFFRRSTFQVSCGVIILLSGGIWSLSLCGGGSEVGLLTYIFSTLLGSLFVLISTLHRSTLLAPGFVMMCAGLGHLGIAYYAVFVRDAIHPEGPLFAFGFCSLPISLLGLLLVVVSIFRRLVFGPPAPPGHCTKCSYNLRGLAEARCPECGTPFDARLLENPQGPASESSERSEIAAK